MGVRETIQLIAAEDAEDGNRQRVGPERVQPKPDHESRLDQAVQHKINRDKVPAGDEMLSGLIQVTRHELMAVKGHIVLQEDCRDTIQRRSAHEPQRHSARRFQEAVNSLQRNSGAIAFMEQPFAAALDARRY